MTNDKSIEWLNEKCRYKQSIHWVPQHGALAYSESRWPTCYWPYSVLEHGSHKVGCGGWRNALLKLTKYWSPSHNVPLFPNITGTQSIGGMTWQIQISQELRSFWRTVVLPDVSKTFTYRLSTTVCLCLCLYVGTLIDSCLVCHHYIALPQQVFFCHLDYSLDGCLPFDRKCNKMYRILHVDGMHKNNKHVCYYKHFSTYIIR